MSAQEPTAELDRLAAELQGTVRSAAAARKSFELAAELGALRRDLDAVTPQIAACSAVLAEGSPLELTDESRTTLEERRAWVVGQLAKVRAALASDPGSLRKGDLWRETKRATTTLARELEEARTTAYEALLERYADHDADLLEALPPGEARNAYRVALDAFEALRARQPQTPGDVTAAATAGRALAQVRERVERDAVPPALQAQWRALREGTLALDHLTPDFRAWLDEHGHTRSIVLRFGAA